MPRSEFRRHFRISLDVYKHLLGDFHQNLTKTYRGRYLPISPEKQILVFLWYVTNQDSQREIAMLFGIGESAVNKITRYVGELIGEHRQKYISWPNNERENDISNCFEDLCGNPNIVGP